MGGRYSRKIRDALVLEAGRLAEQELAQGSLEGALRYAKRAAQLDPTHKPSVDTYKYLKRKKLQTDAAKAAKVEHVAAGRHAMRVQNYAAAALAFGEAMKLDPTDSVLTEVCTLLPIGS